MCSFLSAMNPTAGSFEICERLQRHFATFSCQMPSVADLKSIYSSILSGHMLGWGDNINTMCSRVVDASIGIHSMVSGVLKREILLRTLHNSRLVVQRRVFVFSKAKLCACSGIWKD